MAFKPFTDKESHFAGLMWSFLSEEQRDQCKVILLSALHAEAEASVKHKISDSVSELAKTLLFSKKQWPQLLEQLSAMLTGNDLENNISALRIISSCPDLFEKEQAAVIFQVLLKKLDPVYPPELLAAAVESIISVYVSYSPKKHLKTLMGEALTHIWSVVQKMNMQEHEDECKDIVLSLIGLAEYAPKLFKPLVGAIMQRSIQVVTLGGADLEDDLKHTFIELVVTLCEKMPEAVRKESELSAFIGALFALLADLEDDEDWFTQLENVRKFSAIFLR